MNIRKFLSGTLFTILLVCFQAEGEKYFSDNGDGTVTDNIISLVWQQGEGGTMTWEAALTYCENLGLAGLTDWRLPNINELFSLADDSKFNPSLDTAYFPGVSSSWYWSSTTDARSSTNVWYVNFYKGSLSSELASVSIGVRCVRGGQ